MKKFIGGIDFFGHLLILLISSAFIVLQNNFFAGQLMFICWLPFIIYAVFNLASFNELPNVKQSIYSILNICFLIVLLQLDKLSFIEFCLSFVIGELVGIAAAISFFFLFKKGLNNVRASDLFGVKGAIKMAILFTALIYPYVGEAAIFIGENGFNFYMLVAFVFTFIFGVQRQVKAIGALVDRRNKKPEVVKKEMERALDRTQPMNFDTKVILFSLLAWFLGVGWVWVVYVHNA